jgi:iron complex transport system substrate-binding protein
LAVAAVLILAAMGAAAQADDFPVAIEHVYGTTVIEKQPERVVSLGYEGHDNILALGVKPIAVRDWYGDYPYAVWPWAQAALGDAKPVVLKGDINIEQIAALQPDLILAIYSGITPEEYQLLSQIAPVVARDAESGDYTTPLDVEVRMYAKALGKVDEGEALLKARDERFAAIRAAHPDWEGKSAAVAYYWNEAPGAYASGDPRPQLLAKLGFKTPEALDRLAKPGDFLVGLSEEDLSPIDADVVIWFDEGHKIDGLKLRPTMRAYKEGREIIAGENDLLAGAFSHASLLSIPYALDRLVPLIDLAIDGDPATVVPDLRPAAAD